MASSFTVDFEDLVTSAIAVASHGENLARRHLAADNQISTAQAGWTGRSAAALADRASLWATNSTALVTRIGDHANDMHACARTFAATEKYRAELLADPRSA